MTGNKPGNGECWEATMDSDIMDGFCGCYGDSGADLRVSPAVTRLTVYRRPQVEAKFVLILL